jgi:hypothetical protein
MVESNISHTLYILVSHTATSQNSMLLRAQKAILRTMSDADEDASLVEGVSLDNKLDEKEGDAHSLYDTEDKKSVADSEEDELLSSPLKFSVKSNIDGSISPPLPSPFMESEIIKSSPMYHSVEEKFGLDKNINELRSSLFDSKSQYQSQINIEREDRNANLAFQNELTLKQSSEINLLKSKISSLEGELSRAQQERVANAEMQNYWEKMLGELREKQVQMREENIKLTSEVNSKGSEVARLLESVRSLEFELKKEKLLSDRLGKQNKELGEEVQNQKRSGSILKGPEECLRCLELRKDLVFAEKKTHEMSLLADEAAKRLENERKSRLKELQISESSVYDKINNAVSLSLSYDADSIEGKRQEVLHRISHLEQLSNNKIKRVSEKYKAVLTENSTLKYELDLRPSLRAWRELEAKNKSLQRAVEELKNQKGHEGEAKVERNEGGEGGENINTRDMMKQDRATR